MNQNNNLSVLPFYDSVDKQLRKRTYAYGEVYPLYVQKGYALPFQLMVPKPASGQEPTVIQTVTLTDAFGFQLDKKSVGYFHEYTLEEQEQATGQ